MRQAYPDMIARFVYRIFHSQDQSTLLHLKYFEPEFLLLQDLAKCEGQL